jgi:translation initiation factor IF-2
MVNGVWKMENYEQALSINTMDTKNATINTSEMSTFPPVVAVLGHVDHGKTTLLDAIRKTSIAEREAGGITQKIGASSIEIVHEGKKRSITFIDTPGHEAFSQMRGRGVQAADIALLIVAATEGLRPQTRESIALLQKSQTPFIVVLTKADLPTKNSDKVKQELLKEQIMLEEFGGSIPSIEVSAKTNLNIKELLDLILLLFDLQIYPEKSKVVSNNGPLQAVVIESKLDVRAGARATVVVKNGTISQREELQAGAELFKVRSLLNDQNKQVQSATLGQAVEILGFAKVPAVGSIITRANETIVSIPEPEVRKPLKRELVYKKEEEKTGLAVILVADTQGSLEAILQAFPKEIQVISHKTGEVSEADVLLAKSTGGIVLSFNTKIKPEVTKLAYTEKVLVRNYTIIYELLDEVRDALEGKILAAMEQIFGKAKILAKFPFEKTFAFGINVLEGRMARGDRIRIMRDDEVLGETSITSLRIGKNPTSKVEKGHEAGIVLTTTLDIRVGDMLLSHS